MKKNTVYCLVIVSAACLTCATVAYKLFEFRNAGKIFHLTEPCTIKLEKLLTRRGDKLSDTWLKSIPVRVNGIDCLMLLDTGFSRTMLSTEFCNKHALTGRRVRVDRENSDIDIESMVEIRGRLSVGTVVLDNFPYLQHDLTEMLRFFNGSHQPIMGVLGSDFLNKFNYSINVRDGLLSLGLEEAAQNEVSFKLPITVLENLLFIDIAIQGKSFSFMLDTGASLPLINTKAFALCKGEVREIGTEQFTVCGVSRGKQKFTRLSGVSLIPGLHREILFQIDEGPNTVSLEMLKEWIVAVYPANGYILLTPNEIPQFK